MPDIDAHRLLVFHEVARTGSIAGASRALGWTQPAVSQHLRHMERQAGTPLVLRHSRGVRLTEAGTALARHADAVAARVRAAEEELAAHAELRQGTLRLAAFPSASATLVPAAIRALAERSPDLDVRLREAEPPEALDLLARDEVDVAVTFAHPGQDPADRPGLVRQDLGADPLRVVLARGHRRARPTAPVDLRHLADDAWIAGCERCTESLTRTCRGAGFAPDLRHATDDYVVTQALVAQGLGVALLPRLALTAFQDPRVTALPTVQAEPRTLHVAHRHEADQIPAVRGALRALAEASQALTEPK